MVCISNEDIEKEYYILVGFSAVSAIGSLFIIIPYYLMVAARSYSFKIVFCISCSDFIRSILFIFPSHRYPNLILCYITSYIIQVSIFITII